MSSYTGFFCGIKSTWYIMVTLEITGKTSREIEVFDCITTKQL